MSVEVIFPRVDMDMTSGRIGRWIAADGAVVGKGDPLFEIETDKAAMEIEAPASGTLRRIRAAGEAEIAVGSPVAWIVAESEPWTDAPSSPASGEPPAAEPGAPVRATPLARREAARRGLDLRVINGSGPRGRILSADLRAEAVDFPPAATAVAEPVKSGAALFRNWLGGGSGAPLMLLHGFGSDHAGWRPVLRGLERTCRILVTDLPGHGRSPPASDSATFETLVEATRRTLTDERVEQIHLVGHSLGGAVALALAASGSVDVRSLCLIAPAGLGPEIDGAFLRGLLRAQSAASLAPWLRRLFADPGLVTPVFAEAAFRARAGDALRTFQTALADNLFPDGTQALHLRPMLDRLTIPVSVLWGRRDAIIPARHASELPGHAGVHMISDAGHMPHLEAHALVALLIERLRRSAE